MSCEGPQDLDAALGLQRNRDAAPGRAALEYLAGPAMCHSGGIVQGGFVCAWVDAAMARALGAVHGFDILPLTLELKISYLVAARPGIVVAEGWVIGGGRSVAFVEGQLSDPAGKLLAKATATFRIVRGHSAAR